MSELSLFHYAHRYDSSGDVVKERVVLITF